MRTDTRCRRCHGDAANTLSLSCLPKRAPVTFNNMAKRRELITPDGAILVSLISPAGTTTVGLQTLPCCIDAMQ